MLVGAVLFIWNRHRSPSNASDKSDASTHRTNLVLQAGKWFLPGTTNLFTGMLFDTYVDGVIKSRSAVSNGLFLCQFFNSEFFILFHFTPSIFS